MLVALISFRTHSFTKWILCWQLFKNSKLVIYWEGSWPARLTQTNPNLSTISIICSFFQRLGVWNVFRTSAPQRSFSSGTTARMMRVYCEKYYFYCWFSLLTCSLCLRINIKTQSTNLSTFQKPDGYKDLLNFYYFQFQMRIVYLQTLSCIPPNFSSHKMCILSESSSVLIK